MRKPIQKEVIEKPSLQTLDEQNVVPTASGEFGDGVGNNPSNDANVNFRFLIARQSQKQTNKNYYEAILCESNAAAGCRAIILSTSLFTIHKQCIYCHFIEHCEHTQSLGLN